MVCLMADWPSEYGSLWPGYATGMFRSSAKEYPRKVWSTKELAKCVEKGTPLIDVVKNAMQQPWVGLIPTLSVCTDVSPTTLHPAKVPVTHPPCAPSQPAAPWR